MGWRKRAVLVLGVVALGSAVEGSGAAAHVMPTVSGSDSSPSGDIEISYSLSGVSPGESDEPGRRRGTVTGSSVTLSGTAAASVDAIGVSNIRLQATLSVFGGGQPSLAETFAEEVAGPRTVTLPFTLTADIPAPPTLDDDPFADRFYGEDAEPYARVAFEVRGSKCWGTCATVRDQGEFLVFATGELVDARSDGGDPGSGNVPVEVDPEEASGVPTWTLAVGSGAAVVAAAAAVVHRRRPEDDPDTPHYVLQVSDEVLVLVPLVPVGLRVQVWEVTADGSPVPAAASISVSADPGIVVEPSSGSQDLWSSVSFDPAAGGVMGWGSIHVTATTAHSTHHHTVAVCVTEGYRLEVLT